MNPRLGYLISRYPAISHTFILREIQELRKLGFSIDVASINNDSRPTRRQLAIEERKKLPGPGTSKHRAPAGAVSANLRRFLTNPAGYLRAAFFALRLGRHDLKADRSSAFFYFVEAAMVGKVDAAARPPSPARPFCDPRLQRRPDSHPHVPVQLLDHL